MGISWNALGDKFGREVMLAQASEILADSVHKQSTASEPLDVIFLTMIGGHGYNSSVDIVLGLALKAKGHRVRFVVCDQQLSACEVKKATNRERWNKACEKCWSYAHAIYSRFGLEVIRVSDLIKNCDQPEDLDRWEEIVDASLLKHFGIGVLNESEAVRERRVEYQKSVEVSHQIGESLVAMAPDRVLMSHGIYSTWGPQRELLNEADIPVITFSKCKKRHTEKFNWTTSADWWDVSEEWKQVRDQPLTVSQQEMLEKYLDSRRDHSADTLKYNFGDEESKAATYQRFNLDPNKPTFVAFTNVLWDAASAQREIVFSDPITWITETIRWFESHPDRQLVVKIHPAEVVIGTNQPFASIIREQIPVLPDNVRLIEPHEKVNSWSVMQIADLGIVHTSTVGMEMPLEGIPCAVVSRTHFRDRGFTIDVSDKNAYFDMIKDWSASSYDLKAAKELATRYAFLLFERYQLPFRVFYEPRHTDVRAMSFQSVNDLTANPTMQLIVKCIEEKSDFLLPSDPNEIARHWK